MFVQLGLTNVRRNLSRSMLSVISMGVAAAVLTGALFVAAGYPGHAFLPHRVFAGGDIMIFPRSLSLATAAGQDGGAPGAGGGTAADRPGPGFVRLERDWISELYAYYPDAYDYGVIASGDRPWFDLDTILARLSGIGFIADVYPYYILPAFERFFDHAGGYEKSALAAIRGRDIEKDRTLFYLQDYVAFGRPLASVDEGRYRALVDVARSATPGYGAVGQFGGSVGGKLELALPSVTITPGSAMARFDWSDVRPYSFQVVGGLAFTTAEEPDVRYYATPQVVVPLTVFRTIWDEVTGGLPLAVPQVTVSVSSLVSVETYARKLQELLPDCTVMSVPGAASFGSMRGGLPEAWPVWRRSSVQGSVVTGQAMLPAGTRWIVLGLTCMIAALIVASNTMIILTQRRREIGVLRAVGAKRRDIVVMVMAEIAAISLLGASLGYGVIRVAVIWHQFSAKASLLSIGASALLDGAKITGVTVLSALLFGVFPALRTTAVTTVDVLRSE